MRDYGSGFAIHGVVKKTDKRLYCVAYYTHNMQSTAWVDRKYKENACGHYPTLEAANSAREMALAIVEEYDKREDPLREQMRGIAEERDVRLTSFSREMKMPDEIDLSPFEKCEPLAKRIMWLQNVTGWDVKCIRMPWGYMLAASDFVYSIKGAVFVFERIPDAELI